MKLRKLSTSAVFLISVIVVIVVSLSIVGISSIFADQPIEELVEITEIGSYKPTELADLNADEYTLVDWVDITELFFTYTYWKDVSGDGIIQPNEDVYEQDGFVENTLMGYRIYPIFSTNEQSDYYIIPLSDLERYNGVLVDINIGDNNNLANLKDKSTYWFDRDNGVLYIDRDVIDEAYREDKSCSIRIEVVTLVKNVRAMTRTIDIYTLFDANISDTCGLDKAVPNDRYEKDVNSWLLNNLRYQLVPTSKLAHVSKDDLTVYINATEIDAWVYDETTGMITIQCDPYSTDSVVVKFNKVLDASFAQSALQLFQSSNEESIGQATTLEDALDSSGNMSSIFLKKLTYEQALPQRGTTQRLDYTCYAVETKNGSCEVDYEVLQEAQIGRDKLPVSLVANAVESYWKDAKENKKYYVTTDDKLMYKSGTLSAVSDKRQEVYGDVLYNVFLGGPGKNTSNLDKALSLAEANLFNSIGYSTSESNALIRSWMSWDRENGMYIVGTSDNKFLGGSVSGNVMFDVTCASIAARDGFQNAYEELKAFRENELGRPPSNASDFYAYVTILDVTPPDADGEGWLYVCIWSPSVAKPGYNDHNQRFLAFTKVPYKYEGQGTLHFEKIDSETGARVAGAKYAIYNEQGKLVKTITSTDGVVSCSLAKGKYTIKEIVAPAGYVLNTTPQSFTIDGTKPTSVRMENRKQRANVTLTVYDYETRKNSNPVALGGVQFELYDPGTNKVVQRDLITDSNGQIHFSVSATGVYYLRQTHTIKNYCMRIDLGGDSYDNYTNDFNYNNYKNVPAFDDNCAKLEIAAFPDDNGVNNDYDINKIHCEDRKYMTFVLYAQDEKLLGIDDAYVTINGETITTVGGNYQLENTSCVLLGYTDDGNKIMAKPGELTTNKFTLVNDNFYGSYSYLYVEEAKWSVDGKTYPLGFGNYELSMQTSSKGYTWVDALKISAPDSTNETAWLESVTLELPLPRQRATVTLTVHDQDSKNARLEGVSFELYDANGEKVDLDLTDQDTSTLTTDQNGQISFTVYNAGDYYLRQTNVLDGYYSKYKNGYYDEIPITLQADASGFDQTKEMWHAEQRQYVEIKTHVQDEILKGNTQAEVTVNGGKIYTSGAKYKLTSTHDVILGYNSDGEEVVVKAGNTIAIIDSAKASDGKAYLTASKIKYNGEEYWLPKGEYKWEMLIPSTGYLIGAQADVPNNWGEDSPTTKVFKAKSAVVQERQRVEVTYTVHDEDSTEIRLDGVKFELYDANNNRVLKDLNENNTSILTTDSNGKIKFTVYAVGDYYLKQTNTVKNYYIDNNCKQIALRLEPDTNGEHQKIENLHEEHRQRVTIATHVQDEQLGDNTLSLIGGDLATGSLVQISGAKYNLINTSPILLGYKTDGTPIEIAKDTKLATVTAKADAANQPAYLTISDIKYNGETYKLPNGEYVWVMETASSGYVNNGASADVLAIWSTANQEAEWLSISEPVVKQKRQTASITLYVKSYDDKHRTDSNTMFDGKYKYTIRNNVLTRFLESPVSASNPILRLVDQKVFKTVKSTHISISDSSNECVVLTNNNENYTLKVESTGLAKNAIYQLINIGDIVGMDGTIIRSGTVLGVYTTGNNGYVEIAKLGSKEFANLNEETKASRPMIDAVDLGSLNGTSLPNGTYALVPYIIPDQHIAEEGLSEDIISETKWNESNSAKGISETNGVTFLRSTVIPTPIPPSANMPVAPDIQPNPSDPYDPQNPIVTIDWVNRNMHNKAYRVVDPVNFDSETNVNDVKDMLPTTFAFYLNEDSYLDNNMNLSYTLSFYYEIDSLPDGASLGDEYIEIDGVYAQRFKIGAMTGEEQLQNVISLNSRSHGYKSYSEILANSVVSGSVYNANWINEKLSQKRNGEYKIFIVVDTTARYLPKGSIDQESNYITNMNTVRTYGVLTFKERELVNLD